jgi:hypothetical protein
VWVTEQPSDDGVEEFVRARARPASGPDVVGAIERPATSEEPERALKIA